MAHFDNNSVVPTHRVNRGRISVPARVGSLGALLSARPHGQGNASTGRGGIQGRRQGRNGRQGKSTSKATLPHRHHRDASGSHLGQGASITTTPGSFQAAAQPPPPLGSPAPSSLPSLGSLSPRQQPSIRPSPGPHLSARRWWPNLKVGVLADFNFISY